MKNYIKKQYKNYKQKFEYRKKRLGHTLPLTINIELTTKCNAKCAYCGREDIIDRGIRGIGDMDYRFFEKIVGNIKSLKQKPESVIPVGLGDPLLYHKIFDALILLKKELQGITIQLSTNGICLTEDLMHLITDIELDIFHISINFHDRDKYKKYYRTDQFERVTDNIEKFLKIKGNRKPRTILPILNIKENRNDIKNFKEYWQPKISSLDQIQVRPFNDFGGTIDIEDFVDEDFPEHRYPCPQLYNILMITTEGHCYPCCMGMTDKTDSNLCIGNLKENTIEEIYSKTAHIQEVRKIHKHGKYNLIPKCAACNSWAAGKNIFFKVGSRWV